MYRMCSRDNPFPISGPGAAVWNHPVAAFPSPRSGARPCRANDGVIEQSIIYVGLDVHKDKIVVASAEASLRGEVRQHGTIPNTPSALKAVTARLAKQGAAVLLRGRTVRLWHPTPSERCGPR